METWELACDVIGQLSVQGRRDPGRHAKPDSLDLLLGTSFSRHFRREPFAL